MALATEPTGALADKTSEIEAVITSEQMAQGYAWPGVFYSFNVTYDENWVLVVAAFWTNGAAGGDYLLQENSAGTWSIIGEGGGQMTATLLVSGYGIPANNANALLGGCRADARMNSSARYHHFTLIRKISPGRFVYHAVVIRVRGRAKAIRFAEPKTSRICLA